MTIHAPIDTRIAERQAARRQNWLRVARLAGEMSMDMDSPSRRLRVLDALSFCIDSDLEREMDDLRHDLRIDAEGYALNDEGDRIPNAERRYVPLKSLERNVA